jgi:hypothetical protein
MKKWFLVILLHFTNYYYYTNNKLRAKLTINCQLFNIKKKNAKNLTDPKQFQKLNRILQKKCISIPVLLPSKRCRKLRTKLLKKNWIKHFRSLLYFSFIISTQILNLTLKTQEELRNFCFGRMWVFITAFDTRVREWEISGRFTGMLKTRLIVRLG